MEKYPALGVIVRHGSALAAATGVATLVLVALAAYGSLGWLALAVAAVAAGIAYGLARSYVELVVLITDMLLPR